MSRQGRMNPRSGSSGLAVAGYAGGMAVASLIAYELTTDVLSHVRFVDRSSDLLGGMWATIATIFVFHDSFQRSVAAALSRMAATLVSFILCLLYLAVWPFHPVGMAALIGIGAVVVRLAGRPEDTVTTGITTTVVMVVAALSPHDAWLQPILRFFDTVVGVAVGVAGAWVGSRATCFHPGPGS